MQLRGNVNPNWLHRGGGKWPHPESRPGWGLDLAGWWSLGLPPEDAGGVAVEFGEEVLDAL